MKYECQSWNAWFCKSHVQPWPFAHHWSALAGESATRAEIAERLNLSVKDSLTHLGFLEFVRAVTQTEGVFTLNNDKLAVLAREKLAEVRPSFTPPDDLDEKSKKILKAYLKLWWQHQANPRPAQAAGDLELPGDFFEFNKNYTEKEVNTIIKRFNEDTAGLRRDLVDAKMLARESDGSRYWKVD